MPSDTTGPTAEGPRLTRRARTRPPRPRGGRTRRGLLLACGLMAVLGVGGAATAGWFAWREKKWRGRDVWRGGALVAFLHLAQPLARAYGQVLGWWQTRGTPRAWSVEQCIW